MGSKSIFKSWTAWYGVGTTVVAWLGVAAGHVTVDQALAATLNGCATLGLRFKTDQPVHL